MRRSLLGVVVIGMALSGAVPVRAGEPKTADEIIAKYIEAVGGRARVDSVQSLRMTGRNVHLGGESLMRAVYQRPDKLRIEFISQGVTSIHAFDGEVAWSVNPFMGRPEPQKLPPDQAKVVSQQADIDGPLVDYGKKGHQLKLVGKEEFKGSEVYQLKLTKKTGEVEYHYLDAERFLPVRITGEHAFENLPGEYDVAYEDYRAVDGLLIAHKIEQGGRGAKNDIIYDKVEINVQVPDDYFALPPDAKDPPPTKASPVKQLATPPTPKKYQPGNTGK